MTTIQQTFSNSHQKRYHADPEFRARYLEKQKKRLEDKIHCEFCDTYVPKCNLWNHNKTTKHLNNSNPTEIKNS